MARPELERLTMRFRGRRGDTITALDRIGLEVRDREFAVLVGASACGKSTISRWSPGSRGRPKAPVLVDGRPIAGAGAAAAWCSIATRCFPG